MAVVPMQKITLFGLQRDRKKLLELIQRKGAVQVTEPPAEQAGFVRSNSEKQLAHLDRCSNSVRQALEILDQYAPVKSSLTDSLRGPARLSQAEFDAQVASHEEAIGAARRLCALARKVSEAKAEQVRLRTQQDSFRLWLPLDVSMRCTGTAQTACFVGTVPESLTLDELLTRLGQAHPELEAVHIEIVNATPDQTAIFALCLRAQAQQLGEALRAMGFSQPAVLTGKTPREKIAQLDQKIAAAQAAQQDAESEILRLAPMRPRIEFLVDYYASRKVKYEVIDRLAQTKNTFMLCGYIPQPAEAPLRKALENCDAYVEFEPVPADETPPVLLHNNAFSEPVEGVLEMYSMPSKRDIDPTAIMSVFYYILFGMMLSDAAYGLLMALGCFIVVKKFPNMAAGTQKMLKMFMWCGVSTMVWGVLFGSYFGNAPQMIAATFFHSDFTIPPLWFEPLNDPMRLLMFSFVIGIVHLFTGLGIQFYQLWRAGQKWDAICDVGFWYGLVTGLIVWLCSTSMLQSMANLSFVIPAGVVLAAQLLAAVSALGIILTSGRASHNPVLRLLKGLYGLYGVTNYLSDILSYSRLLALGLATGVIASVINQMGTMMGGGVGGAILFIIVFLIGHTFNIGINLLGAYVHTNRLQYVEFFGKFYEGGGEKFTPFARTEKFVHLKEEQ